MLKSIFVIAFAGILFSLSLYAQNDPSKIPQAYKFKEFGRVSPSDLRKKVESFFVLLREHDGLKGFVVNYGPRAQINTRRTRIVKLISRHDFDLSRVYYVDGRFEKQVRTVLWVIPPGAENPVP